MNAHSKRIVSGTTSILFGLVAGCSTFTPVTSPSKNEQLTSIPSPTNSPPPKFDIQSMPNTVKISTEKAITLKQSPNFNNSPTFSRVQPGKITVIFNDQYKIRQDSTKRKLSSNGMPTAASNINNILQSNEIKELSDFSGGIPEDELDKQERHAEAVWNCDIPHWKSMYVFEFNGNSKIEAILKAIQSLPFVQSAYLTPEFDGGATLISRWNFSNLSGTKPTDSYFSNPEQDWYWFNRHRVFDAWTTMGSITLPPIAVIDSGFDIDPSWSLDRPAYRLNEAQAFDILGNAIGSGVAEPSQNTYSHGTMVASVISSPKNNTQGASGVLPGAPIVPLKVYSVNGQNSGGMDPRSIASAIRYAYTNTSARVSNISIQTNGYPISIDNTIKSAIAYATSYGHSSVIIAGNLYRDTDSIYPYTPAGELIVGGSQRNGYNWRYASGSSYLGSSYGRLVAMTASAEDILVPVWNPSDHSRNLLPKSGTSLAAPMVAATLAVVRELYFANGGANYSDGYNLVNKLNSIVWASATIGPSQDFQYGENLHNTSFGGNSKLRDLNMANAFEFAKRPTGKPLVRIMNSDDAVWWAKNADWNNIYSQENLSSDSIWDLRNDGLTTNDNIAFTTYNFGGKRAHGYQLWQNGAVVYEHLGGAAERRAPWGILHGTVGEDNNATDTGWHYTIGWPALL
jgi:Subtilisin-like serine proteases